jgi:hypothetical protein
MATNESPPDWMLSVQGTIKKVVEEKYQSEAHRWPILHLIEGKCYNYRDKYIIIKITHLIGTGPARFSGVIETFSQADAPDEVSLGNVEVWHPYLRKRLDLRPQDAVMIVPIVAGSTMQQKWENMNQEQQEIWRKQIMMNVESHYYYLKGFNVAEGFFIPPGYRHLADDCQAFLSAHPNYNNNVFIMMKFDDANTKLKELENEVRGFLQSYGLNPLRADDRIYPKDRDLWNNVCIYMICCKFGIAILENVSQHEYNPNVALEYGFMRALDKRVLLLADKGFPKPRVDVVGKLREHFDINDIKESIKTPLEKWVRELPVH